MYVNKTAFFILNLIVCGNSLGQSETPNEKPKSAADLYIEKYKELAIVEMHRSRIPASITIAQGLFETACGSSKLCVQGNNHFGIKCKKGWTGKAVYQDDDELSECFRGYDSAMHSFKDHSDFLMGNPRYAELFDLDHEDYKGWAYGLKKAGYATNPNYAEKLIENIEKYQLQQYDKVAVTKEQKKRIDESYDTNVRKLININQTPGVLAKEGDTWQLIAIENEMRVWQLLKYNDLEDGARCDPGDTIYLKPKRSKAEGKYHVMQEGESLLGISQLYAVKLSKLRDRNMLVGNEEPMMGETVFLNETRNTKPRLAGKHESQLNFEKDKPAGEIVQYPVSDPHRVNVSRLLGEEMMGMTPKAKADTVHKIVIASIDSPTAPLNYPDSALKALKADTASVSHIAVSKELLKTHIADSTSKLMPKPDTALAKGMHRISKGETYYSISKKYGMTVHELQAWNKNDTLKTGKEIWVVAQPLFHVPGFSTAPASQLTATSHKVKSGETLFSIAKKYKVKPSEISETNNLKGKPLKAGQVLIIPEQVHYTSGTVAVMPVDTAIKPKPTKKPVAKPLSKSGPQKPIVTIKKEGAEKPLPNKTDSIAKQKKKLTKKQIVKPKAKTAPKKPVTKTED